MIYDIISSCYSGFDLLIIYLLFCGYSQTETAQLLGVYPSTVYRRIKTVYGRIEKC